MLLNYNAARNGTGGSIAGRDWISRKPANLQAFAFAKN
jgi:hypothetical protein